MKAEDYKTLTAYEREVIDLLRKIYAALQTGADEWIESGGGPLDI